MNTKEAQVLLMLSHKNFTNQRDLADKSGFSLGLINKSLKALKKDGYLDDDYLLTRSAKAYLKENKPKRAVILAAGLGMRMVPINVHTPKPLVKVKGEVLIERLIRQLHEADIRDIDVVIGFMKEQFEYLIDQYQVRLVVNSQYATRNNLHSLSLVYQNLNNCYVVPGDIYCQDNPFNQHELYSWYMVSDTKLEDSAVRVNRKDELVLTNGQELGNRMIGIAYLRGEESKKVQMLLMKYEKDKRFNHSFWEECLFDDHKMIVYSKLIEDEKIFELVTFEQLKELENPPSYLALEILEEISRALNCPIQDIKHIELLKKGTTNRTLAFTCLQNKYVLKIPLNSQEHDYQNEAQVYEALKDCEICEEVIYFNQVNGLKISKYIDHYRTCNPKDLNDLTLCMKKLKQLHELDIKVDHEIDLFKMLEDYEKKRGDVASMYIDYDITKMNVLKLRDYIKAHEKKHCLTHIDAVKDNFLFTKKDEIFLIDFEYAGMQDPHLDIAMFCIYSLLDQKEVDRAIDAYFDGQCDKETRLKIYCFIAIAGLIWSNWCESESNKGIEFGEYSLSQYRYAKEYYRLVEKEIF